MKNMLKDAAVLFAITLCAGLVLGFVYNITKEPIAIAEEKAAQEAYKEVFPDAASFEVIESAVPEDAEYEAAWAAAGYESVEIGHILHAKDSTGTVLGYVIPVTTHAGYGGDITFTMGIRMDGTVNGISILSISETAGLGMKAEEVLKPQFADKQVAKFTYTKSGSTMDSELDAISGATITTDAVVTAANGGLYYFQTQLGGSGNEAK